MNVYDEYFMKAMGRSKKRKVYRKALFLTTLQVFPNNLMEGCFQRAFDKDVLKQIDGLLSRSKNAHFSPLIYNTLRKKFN